LNVETIIADLKKEISRLTKAIAALEEWICGRLPPHSRHPILKQRPARSVVIWAQKAGRACRRWWRRGGRRPSGGL